MNNGIADPSSDDVESGYCGKNAARPAPILAVQSGSTAYSSAASFRLSTSGRDRARSTTPSATRRSAGNRSTSTKATNSRSNISGGLRRLVRRQGSCLEDGRAEGNVARQGEALLRCQNAQRFRRPAVDRHWLRGASGERHAEAALAETSGPKRPSRLDLSPAASRRNCVSSGGSIICLATTARRTAPIIDIMQSTLW